MIKVLVVDDSSFMRHMIARIIDADDRFEVIAQAKNGEEAVALSQELNPDLVTLDIEMPVMDGLTALPLLVKQKRCVVMVSSLTTKGAQATLDALDMGAVDFVPKDSQGGTLLKASEALRDKLYSAVRGFRSQGRPAARAAAARPLGLLKQNLPLAKLAIIGSSTGGPRALQEILPALPAGLSVPIVIAQHMPKTFTAAMSARLNGLCPYPVSEGADGTVLEAGHVYIAPGGLLTEVIRNDQKQLMLKVTADNNSQYIYHPSVEVFAASALQTVGGTALLAVMLTGMGHDGQEAFEAIKKAGGYIMAQDQASSIVYGMPKAVAPIADEIVPLSDVAGRVKRLLAS